MTLEETIQRINELYHKSQKQEQKQLRQVYIDSVKNNLRGQLENMEIERPDGTIEKVTKKPRDSKRANE